VESALKALKACSLLILALLLPSIGRPDPASSALPPGRSILFVSASVYFGADSGAGQPSPRAGSPSAPLTVAGMPHRVLSDQAAIWTSPARIHKRDLRWILPLGATLGVLIGTDEHVMGAYAPADPALESHLNTIGNTGLAVLGGIPVALYASSLFTHNERARETGIIGVQAIADAAIVGVVMKFATQRERPYQNLEGRFWNSPSVLNSSFPSEHSLLSWTAATVIAEEYPRPLTRWLAYGLAAAVSGSRVAAERHFPSDAVIGIAAGYLIGHYVFKARHNRDLAEETPTRQPLVRAGRAAVVTTSASSVPVR